MQIYKGSTEDYGHDEARIIEVSKNRFGRTGEIALRMGSKGYDFNTPCEKQS
jgi:hypothetical protein